MNQTMAEEDISTSGREYNVNSVSWKWKSCHSFREACAEHSVPDMYL